MMEFNSSCTGNSLRRPKPMTDSLARLQAQIAECGRRIGLEFDWQTTGGVCDGNRLAALGVPNVDTMGVQGGNIHSHAEYMLIPSSGDTNPAFAVDADTTIQRPKRERLMLFRPVRESDLDQLNELARQSLYGLTTVPKDSALMGKRVRESERSFANLIDADPQGQLYLFVLIDPESDRVVGSSGIVSKVGGFKPFYAYRLEYETQTSVTLDHEMSHPVLHLVKEHDGPSEIGSLFLHPDYRGGGRGRLLSCARFLFMAEFEHLFEQEVIAEMRGVIDDQGSSPFWESLGSHFFPLDLPNADMLTLTQKDFIEELMPKHPIYLDLLSDEAIEAVAAVHPNTVPARRMLESEGFEYQNLVDIFEAGPVLHCQRGEIRSIAQSRVRKIDSILETPSDDSLRCLVAISEGGFRASLGRLVESESGISVDQLCCKHLGVGVGDSVRYVESSPKR